jgi:hypothetical protein
VPKTFPINLTVEEIALGTVLRKLHSMPGIVKLDFNLGHGGDGPGREKLEKAAKAKHAAKKKKPRGKPAGKISPSTKAVLATLAASTGPVTRQAVIETLAPHFNPKAVYNAIWRCENLTHWVKKVGDGFEITNKGKAVHDREAQHAS